MAATAHKTLPYEVTKGIKDFGALRELLDKLESEGAQAQDADAAKEAGEKPAPEGPAVTAPVTTRRRRKMDAQTAPAPRAGSNTITFDHITEKMKEFGEAAGRGADTQIQSLVQSAEGSYFGVLDRDKNKHGKGIDDAMHCANLYTTARSKVSAFDRKAPTARKTASYFRKSIQLGSMTSLGPSEPMATINKLVNIWKDLRRRNTPDLEDAVTAYMKFVRTQLKRTEVVEDSELKQFCFKPGRAPATLEDHVERIRKQAVALLQGKAEKNTIKDDSPEIKAIIQACTKRLTAIARERGQQAAA